MARASHLFLVVVLLHLPLPLFGLNFGFNGFRQSDGFLFLQSSSMEQGKLSLTRKGISDDIGRVLYAAPILFKEDRWNVSSFSTTFIFSIEPGPEGLAQGMSFLIAPNADPIEDSSRGFLGLFNKSNNGDPSSHTFAVELDTYPNPEFLDMDDNHVGIDINGIISATAASPVYLTHPAFLDSTDGYSVNLKSGQPSQIWIDYDGNQTELNISVSGHPGKKPPYPFFSNSSFNLSTVLRDNMYIGFSASTAILNNISVFVHAWSFSNEGPSPEITLPNSQSNCKHNIRLVDISVTGSSVAAIICILLTGMAVRKHCWKNDENSMPRLVEEINMNNMQRFSYKELSRATQGFSEKNLLGRGGFGTVHHGTLPNGTAIAVKLASKESQQGVKEFIAEVSIIGRLRHRNLLPLLGWCSNPRGLALVYEHMPNGSLDTYLFKEKKMKKTCPLLTWTTRCKILQGVAAALVYLHEEWEQKIIHRDVKASNVLLDGEFNARLGDFGLARLYKHNTINSMTTNVAGTFGYLAPEYVLTRKATEKVDVYSFGALLLEVITGKRIGMDSSDIPLVDYVWQLHKSECLLQAIDSSLLECGDCDHDAAVEVLRLGLLCLHPHSSSRPCMRLVLRVLTKDAPLPHMPATLPPLMDIFCHFPLLISQTTIAETSSGTSHDPEDSDSQQLCR